MIAPMVYTAAEVAKALRTQPSVVNDLLVSGEIPAYKEGRNWKIPIKSLEQYITEKAEREAAERRKHEEVQSQRV